jgi:uncharacterized protein
MIRPMTGINRKWHVLFCVMMVLSTPLFAQIDPVRDPSLFLEGKYFGDRLVLRWAPVDPDLWQFGNNAGYRIERTEITGSPSVDFTPLAETIFPWSLDEFASRGDTTNTFLMVAVQVLHGNAVIPELNDPLQAIKTLSDEQNSRFSFALLAADLSPEAAESLGLQFVDTNVQPDRSYMYRVFFDGLHDELDTDTAYLMVSTDRIPPIPTITNTYSTSGDSVVTLHWGKENNENFTAFLIDRSDDGGNTYQPLHDHPYISSEDSSSFFTFTDQLDENYHPYFYRIRGITMYGEISEPSGSIVAMGRDQKPPPPPENAKAEVLSPQEIRIIWETDSLVPDHAGFLIQKSSSLSGPFQWITMDPLPDTARSFIDAYPNVHSANYYKIYSLDTAVNLSPSNLVFCQMKDTIPPAPPAELQGSIDTTGNVILTWPWGEEPDLIGYRVYASHKDSGEYIQATKHFLEDTVFQDTIPLKTYQEKIYYKIVAVDAKYNHSEFSDVLEIKKPDLIPPLPPVFRNSRATREAVIIEWIKSPSPDVEQQIIYRKTENRDWEILTVVGRSVLYLIDSTTQSGLTYRYAVEAVDDDSLFSGKSQPVIARLHGQQLKEGIEDLSADLDRNTRQVNLSWTFSGIEDKPRKFVIYRSFRDLGLLTHKTVPGNVNSFSETISEGEQIDYAVKIIFEDGGESRISEIVTVQY